MTEQTTTTTLSTGQDLTKEYRKLREVLTGVQVLTLIEAIGRAQERAVARGCNQQITITFNANGKPRWLSVSDDVELKP